MQINEAVIRDVVAQVLAEVGQIPPLTSGGFAGRNGVFHDATEANCSRKRSV